MKHQILLASASSTRQNLLYQARIPFTILSHNADETECDIMLPIHKLVPAIAIHKMNHVIHPDGAEGDIAFILTADTMCLDFKGRIHGKPIDKNDVIAKLKALRGTGIVGSAFCLDKRVFKSGAWHTEQRTEQYVQTSYVWDMPDHWIERYLEAVPEYASIGGAINIEMYGAQFLKSINGSYSTILGLPMFELRESLELSGFFEKTSCKESV